MLAALLFAISAAIQATVGAAAQPTIVLAPVTVENYRVLQRVSRNAGWASTAYKNYLVGLFEGLLYAEGGSEQVAAKLFCLPPQIRDSDRGRLSTSSNGWRTS